MEWHPIVVEAGTDPLLTDLRLILVEIGFAISFVHKFEIFFDVAVEYFVANSLSAGFNRMLHFLMLLFLLLALHLIHVLRLRHLEFMLQFDHLLSFLYTFIARKVRRHLLEVDRTHLL
jgi:hypothetical protein